MRNSYGYPTPFVLIHGIKHFVWESNHEARIRDYGERAKKTWDDDDEYAQSAENGRFICPVFDTFSRHMPLKDRYW